MVDVPFDADDHLAGTVGVASAAPAARNDGPRRDPQGAVRFADRLNAGLGLSPQNLLHKQALMSQGGLKMSRCMPQLFMADLLGPYWELGKLSDKPAPVIWIQGDAHLENFGVVKGPDGHAAFGLNDFDMTCKGSPAMDLDRLAFSLTVYMQEKGIDGAPQVVDTMVRAYLDEMRQIAAHGPRPACLVMNETSGAVQALVAKKDRELQREDDLDVHGQHQNDKKQDAWIDKIAEQGKHGEWQFKYGDDVQPVDAGTSQRLSQALEQYDHAQGSTPSVQRPLQVYGFAEKLDSGGSSFGQPRYWALVASSDPQAPPVVLEIKQEQPAPLVGWHGDPQAAIASSQANWTGNLARADAGQVVAGQAAMGAGFNPLSGTTSMDGVSYLVREREPCKGALGGGDLQTTDDLQSYAAQLGRALARAHGRSSDTAQQVLDWAGDPATFSGRLNAFAQAYTGQAEADAQAYAAAHPDAAGLQVAVKD